ncbi:MAG TPA: Trm112 family protein [Phototrophicaceae bacterium]|nr:Trm112 family protein [Phototrophicaceae bacterium]
MIRRMLDVLVCPFDKESELELFEFKTRPMGNIAQSEEKKSGSESGLKSNNNRAKDSPVKSSNAVDMDNDVVIEDGVLFCNNCLRFYPIVEEIPIILPDELRDKNNDLDILRKWSDSLPEKVVKRSLPWHL